MFFLSIRPAHRVIDANNLKFFRVYACKCIAPAQQRLHSLFKTFCHDLFFPDFNNVPWEKN